MLPRLPNLTHNRHRQERKLYNCRNNFITSIAIFHTSSLGLRYSLVFSCFSFFISIELVTKRNPYICVSISLMFQMIDIGSLLMPISRPGLFTFLCTVFISYTQPRTINSLWKAGAALMITISCSKIRLRRRNCTRRWNTKLRCQNYCLRGRTKMCNL